MPRRADSRPPSSPRNSAPSALQRDLFSFLSSRLSSWRTSLCPLLCSALHAFCVKSFFGTVLVISLLLYVITPFFLAGCSRNATSDPAQLTFLIESNPTN